jgi:hypothetical protein
VSAVPPVDKAQIDAFVARVANGSGCEATITTPKGQIYTCQNNYELSQSQPDSLEPVSVRLKTDLNTYSITRSLLVLFIMNRYSESYREDQYIVSV